MLPRSDLDQNSSLGACHVRPVFSFIQALNVASHNLASYPKGHPLIVQSFQKVENILQQFFESQNQLALGIAKNAIMLGTKFLDRKNPVFRSFAQILFGHGIVSLTFLRGIALSELIDFCGIISQKRNDIAKQGGILALLSKAHVRNIQVQLIDYRAFQTRAELSEYERGEEENRSSAFWEKFVQGLFDGTLDPHGVPDKPSATIDPETLAGMINEKSLSHEASSREAIDFPVLRKMERNDFQQLVDEDNSTRRLSRFMTSLKGVLRQRFLDQFFNALSKNDDIASSVLSCFPGTIILDALEGHTSDQRYIPPNIIAILQKLKKSSRNTDSAGINDILQHNSNVELTDKFNIIFKEDEVDRFVPLDYQKVLRTVIRADNLTVDELSQVRELRKTLADQTVGINLTSIIVAIIAAQGDGHVSEALKHSLRDRCTHLVRDGHFQVLTHLLQGLRGKTSRSGNHQQRLPPLFTEIFTNTEFIEELLNAPEQWGKEKHPSIMALIKAVGKPFVKPLLDRLAEESSMALRQFYLDLVISLGPVVTGPAIERLQDRRWYYVRNLVIILRELGDPLVLKAMHHLAGHPHPKVRQELLQTFITFNDPMADRLLLEEMASQDPSRCLKAIMMAGKSRSEEVFQRLIGLLKRWWLNRDHFEMKKAAIHTLAEIGDPAAVPVLHSILKSNSLLFPRKAKLIKLQIIESLARYPAEQVSSVLKDIAASGSHELGNRAALVMKSLEARGL